jgi:hypothetical protein
MSSPSLTALFLKSGIGGTARLCVQMQKAREGATLSRAQHEWKSKQVECVWLWGSLHLISTPISPPDLDALL